MNNSKLYSILEHFDKYEQNRCRKYIISPYFNKNQALIDVYDVLIKNVNSVRLKELTREMVWVRIHQDKKFDDVRCRKYLSDLLKLIEGFLSQQMYEKENLQQAAYLIEAVGEKKMEKLYGSTMRTARRISNNSPFRSASFHLSQYLIELNYYDLTESDMHRSEKANLEIISDSLDRFYFSEKLRIYCSVLMRERFTSHKYKVEFIQHIVDYLKSDPFDDIPSVLIYYQIHLTILENEDESHYFKLKKLLRKYSLNFPSNEAYQIYTYAINYCIRMINKGNPKFLQELFEVYDQLINGTKIFIEEQLSPWTFKNMVTVALRLGKFDWTEKFIHEYKDSLPTENRDNAVSFNLATLYRYQKKHDDVIRLLSTIEYEDVSYNLDSKSMLIATYYETEEIEPLYSLLESFRVYLNRHNDIPPQRRNNYKNLIKFTKKLTKILPGDQNAVKKLKDEVGAAKGIASAKWLKEKIAELEK